MMMIRQWYETRRELRELENDAISIHSAGSRRSTMYGTDSSMPSRHLAIGSSIHVRAVDSKQQKQTNNSRRRATASSVVALLQSNHEPRNLSGNNEDHDIGQQSFEVIQARACELARKQYDGDLRANGIRDHSHQYPSFSRKEILEGRYLGRGSTCIVAQVNGFRLTDTPDLCSASPPPDLQNKAEEEGEQQDDIGTTSSHSPSSRRFSAMLSHKQASRSFIIKNCYRESGDSRYVIKQLQKRVIHDPKELLQGLADLNLETKFLSSLPHHPNIIKLRAIADGDRFHPDYFLVLDRLVDTLEQRLVQWKAKAKKLDAQENFFQSLKTRYLQQASTETMSILEERARLLHDQVWTAYDLSSAIAHLHKHAIMHRDIKPSNIGFDIRNDVKIFDFGLGKEIPSNPNSETQVTANSRTSRETWRLTAMVGTPRYMAPEVALGLPYNESCDVYSFGIVVWQIMTLNTKTYGNSNRNNAIDFFVKSVWDGPQKRPSMVLKGRTVHHNFLPCLQRLVPSCWNHDWQSRPTMEQVESTLRDEVLHGRRMVNGDVVPTSNEHKTMPRADCLDSNGFHGAVITNGGCKRSTPTGPLSLSVSILHRLGRMCKRTTSGVMFPSSKQGTVTSSHANNMMMDSTEGHQHDPLGRRFYEQDLLSFSSLTCPMRHRRRLTHQSRRSTFCLEMDAFAKIPHDTEHMDFSDYADDDSVRDDDDDDDDADAI